MPCLILHQANTWDFAIGPPVRYRISRLTSWKDESYNSPGNALCPNRGPQWQVEASSFTGSWQFNVNLQTTGHRNLSEELLQPCNCLTTLLRSSFYYVSYVRHQFSRNSTHYLGPCDLGSRTSPNRLYILASPRAGVILLLNHRANSIARACMICSVA